MVTPNGDWSFKYEVCRLTFVATAVRKNNGEKIVDNGSQQASFTIVESLVCFNDMPISSGIGYTQLVALLMKRFTEGSGEFLIR